MDLLEYQGKQLFARHGVPVPDGKPATSVDEAVAAADEIGYPCVVKAQVLIGGRGKAGGIKVVKDRDEARAARRGDPRDGHPRPHGPRGVGRGRQRHRRGVLRVDRLRPLGEGAAGACSPRRAAWTSRRSPRRDPNAIARLHVDPLLGFQGFHGRRLAFEAGVAADVVRPVGALLAKLYDAFVAEEAMLVEVNPLIVAERPQRQGARREGHARRQLLLPPPRQRRAAQRRRRGPAGADGQGARPHLRQARRRHRHPRQRRRARDEHARRRLAGRRRARELPGRRRRLEGRGDHAAPSRSSSRDPKVKAVLFNIFGGITRCDEVARGLIEAFDQIKPTVPFVVRLDGTNDKEGRELLAEATCPTSTPPRRCSRRPRRSWSWRRHERPDRQGHEALRLRASPAARARSTR